MHKIYQSDGIVSVLDVRPLSEGPAGVVPESATKVIPELNTNVIPEGCSRKSRPCKTEKTYKKRTCAAGFTLIELLVVVLIIGILAAVALPQYRVAVQKTRTLSLMPLLRSISDAERIYRMENGTYTLSFADLSIDMPAGGRLNSAGDKIDYNNFHCFLRTDENNLINSYSAYCNDSSPGAPSLEKYFSSEKFICWSKKDAASFAHRVCSNISNRTEADTHSTGGAGYSFR